MSVVDFSGLLCHLVLEAVDNLNFLLIDLLEIHDSMAVQDVHPWIIHQNGADLFILISNNESSGTTHLVAGDSEIFAVNLDTFWKVEHVFDEIGLADTFH